MGDMILFMRRKGMLDKAAHVLRLCRGFDYVTTSNCLLAALCFTQDYWWSIMISSGVFLSDSEHFRAACKELSDTVKKTNNDLTPDERVSLYECASLYGAMCPPVPGWDPIEQTRDLADGGQIPHGLLTGSWMTQGQLIDRIQELVKCPAHSSPEVRSFEDWLKDCEWERSGAATLGRVEYELSVNGEERRGSFRARKNLVLDVVPVEELIARTRAHDTQENKALIKSEFGKIRLAVSAPLEVYLQQAFLFAVSGNSYLSWPGNTLEETITEEMTRNEKTFVRMAQGASALPYDFQKFDHQPRTSEIVGFQNVTFSRALAAANVWQRDDVNLFEHLLVRGFEHATVTSPPGLGDQRTFRVKGGLMSGLRSTSAVGSGWNSVLGETSRDLANKFRGPGRGLNTWQIVRGDDTQVVSDSYLDVLAVKLGYDLLGAEANESKFTLRPGRTEFLRVETSDRARAYPCRTVPLLFQRRPWSTRPPTGDASLTRITKVGSVLARRLTDASLLEEFVVFVVERMLSKMGVDHRLAKIPVNMGGLGLFPWDGRWHVRQWSPSPPIPVNVTNSTGFRTHQEAKRYAEMGVPVTEGEAARLAERSLRTKLALDDVLELAGVVRRVRRSELRARTIVRTDTAPAIICDDLGKYAELLQFASSLRPEEGAFQKLEIMARLAQRYSAPDYASEKRAVERITALSNLAAIRKKSLGKMLRMYEPNFYGKLVEVERRLKLRRSAAVDYLLGDLSIPGADRMPPCAPRLTGIAGAVFVEEMNKVQSPASYVETMRRFEAGANCFAKALVESPYGRALLTL
nr:MAG: RNA-dependent RNA polymerase [Totiviridae sp.]